MFKVLQDRVFLGPLCWWQGQAKPGVLTEQWVPPVPQGRMGSALHYRVSTFFVKDR